MRVKKIKDYYSHTAPVMKKVGDAIMYSTGLLAGLVPTMPIDDDGKKLWIMWWIGIIGIVGKTITGFFAADNGK